MKNSKLSKAAAKAAKAVNFLLLLAGAYSLFILFKLVVNDQLDFYFKQKELEFQLQRVPIPEVRYYEQNSSSNDFKAPRSHQSKQLVPEHQQERKCLQEALWHESRGESKEGIHAVLSVIHNRLESDKFPSKSYCGVIYQPKQFSYVLERKQYGLGLKPIPKSRQEQEVLAYIEHLADKAVRKEFKPSLPKETLWYTTTKIRPAWTRTKAVHNVIGNHRFYKERHDA